MDWLKRFKHEIRETHGSSSRGVGLVSHFAHWKEVLVRPDSAICIEGYPRSANTYSVAAMLVSQPEFDGHIGRHTHLSGQVLRAVQFGVPTLVIIRKPLAAAASLRVFAPWMSAKQCLQDYQRFYSGIAAAREGYVLVRFEDITRDYNIAIDALNDRFDLSLAPFDGTEETVRRCFAMVEDMDRVFNRSAKVSEDRVGRPSEAREALKERAREEIDSPVLKPLRERCEAVHRELLGTLER